MYIFYTMIQMLGSFHKIQHHVPGRGFFHPSRVYYFCLRAQVIFPVYYETIIYLFRNPTLSKTAHQFTIINILQYTCNINILLTLWSKLSSQFNQICYIALLSNNEELPCVLKQKVIPLKNGNNVLFLNLYSYEVLRYVYSNRR